MRNIGDALDYFAGCVITGIITNPSSYALHPLDATDAHAILARFAWDVAEAMLQQGSK